MYQCWTGFQVLCFRFSFQVFLTGCISRNDVTLQVFLVEIEYYYIVNVLAAHTVDICIVCTRDWWRQRNSLVGYLLCIKVYVMMLEI